MTSNGENAARAIGTAGTSRKPGRPRGARTRVLREGQALGRHHFAFLRSWLQGLDMRQAWERYLGFGELSTDRRYIERQRAALLRQVLREAQALDASLAPEQRISAELALLAHPPAGQKVVSLPDLDEFVDSQGLDRELHSEAELLREYREYFGLEHLPSADRRQDPPGAGRASVQPQIQALRRIELLLARQPAPGDPLALWLSPALADRLKSVGIETLGQLVSHINTRGANWWRRVPGLGPARTASLTAWLRPLSGDWPEALHDGAQRPKQAQAASTTPELNAVDELARFGPVPLERLQVPARLLGGSQAPGVFATRLSNRWGVQDDRQAIEAWLAQFQHQASTWRAYRKEVERFYLWCLLERGKPLSSIDGDDAHAYRDFIRQPPPAWCCAAAMKRSDPAWRPFRGPLQPASQRQALQTLQALFDGLCDANYLVGNPWRAVNRDAVLAGPRIDTRRSFAEAEWQFIQDCVAQAAASARSRGMLTAGAEARRLRLVLELLAGTGLRLSEISAATTASLRSVQVNANGVEATVLYVPGKGGKGREVPLAEELCALVAAHHADAQALGPLPVPAPLICTLADAPPRSTIRADRGLALQRPDGVPRALGASGLYRMLKRFFQRIAARAQSVEGLDPSRLRAASTHWLRHTFARQSAAAQLPAEVLQQTLGHASFSTTTLYLETEPGRAVREFEKLRHRRQGR